MLLQPGNERLVHKGALTRGRPKLIHPDRIPPDQLALAVGLSAKSTHPLSKALCKHAKTLNIQAENVTDIQEHPGFGLSGTWQGQMVRLGKPDWYGGQKTPSDKQETSSTTVCLQVDKHPAITFQFEDELRQDAASVVRQLNKDGFELKILSGDTEASVANVSQDLGIEAYASACTPEQKVEHIAQARTQGAKVLMVGDGINDAPALTAALTSMAPATASDVGRMAADFVFTGDDLKAVPTAISIAKRADALVKQNFALAITYNVIAVPIAVLGFASPMIAAIAMSSSSLLVVANALRLRLNTPTLSVYEPATETPLIKPAQTGNVWKEVR